MEKATRWLKGFLGLKKDKENVENNSNYGEKKEKRRWSFVKSGKYSGGLTQISVTDGAWMRSYIDETEKEQNKHAIAVAVADATVAPAQAEVAVVRLTSHGKGGFDWSFMAEDYNFSTTQGTPRFVTCGQANSPVTPTKSVFGDGFFRQYSNCPNYMSNTQSFKAKLRSLSAPKQLPNSVPKKRLSLNEIMASRTSFWSSAICT